MTRQVSYADKSDWVNPLLCNGALCLDARYSFWWLCHT